MCYNCKCGDPNDDMGDPKNITNKTIEELAKLNGMSVEETKKEILKMLKRELGDEIEEEKKEEQPS